MRDNRFHKLAKKNKNDEYYTYYETVEEELRNYDLEGKTVYCPCDDYRWSEFVNYFRKNFETIGLKRLIATNYDLGDGAYLFVKDKDSEASFKVDGTGDYKGYGEYFDECDVVCTNPPFSIWREFAAYCLFEKKKDIIILGTLNCAMYKGFADLVFSDQLRFGFTARNHVKFFKTHDGEKQLTNAVWFTTLPSVRVEPLQLTERYEEGKYRTYDNYDDVINVDRTKLIPCDYDGLIGVPLSYLRYWCPQQFEIVDAIGVGGFRKCGYVDGKSKFVRLVIRKKV